MFTGIVSAIGELVGVTPRDGGVDLTIRSPYQDLVLGESVAVNGACLTVADIAPPDFTVHAVVTTTARTTLGAVRVGTRVNLERAVQVGERLGGHLVQGHIDGVGRVTGVISHDDVRLIEIELPPEVAAVTIPLGSITVDGVSLTVNALAGADRAQVAIVPFTLQHTTLGEIAAGDHVQLEGDLVGKHVQHQAAIWRTIQEAG